MDAVFIGLGIIVLAVTLIDVFLTVLNYDEDGLFVNRIVRGEWLLLRSITRRTGRRWRGVVLRQVTGLLLITTIVSWLVFIVLGFALIYLGAMGMDGSFQTDKYVNLDFWGALYLSIGQFSTVGIENMTSGVVWVQVLTVLQALLSVSILSFIITYLGAVYGVVASLRDLCSRFHRLGDGISDPVTTLEPFFTDGRERDLDLHLGAIRDAFNSYRGGLAQNRGAYYFQSGRDQFSLPFAIYMVSGVVGALRWGLPSGTPAQSEPTLMQLTDAFEQFRIWMHHRLRWDSAPLPVAVSNDEFARAIAQTATGRVDDDLDPWVVRFLVMNRRMASVTSSDAPIDPDDAYRRYLQWLPFRAEAQQMLAAVSLDLDYQPVYRGLATTADDIPLPVADASEPRRARIVNAERAQRGAGQRIGMRTGRWHRFVGWLRRRHLFIDPGWTRLVGAGRAIGAVVLAIAIIVPLATMAGEDPVHAAVFAGLVALFATPTTLGWGRGRGRWAGIVALVPAAAGVALGAVVPRDLVGTTIAIAVIAALAAWVSRFGPHVAALGILGFVAYYFALLVKVEVSGLPLALAAASVAVVCAWLVDLIPGPRLTSRLHDATSALFQRTEVLLTVVADAVSTGRRDPRIIRLIRAEQSVLRTTAEFIAGNLDHTEVPTLGDAAADDLRLRVFDVQLATQNLVDLLPSIASVSVTINERARLAAELVQVRKHIDAHRHRRGDAAQPAAPGTPTTRVVHTPTTDAPVDWSPAALRILEAIRELRTSADALSAARAAVHDAVHDAVEGRRDGGAGPAATPASPDAAPEASALPAASATSGASAAPGASAASGASGAPESSATPAAGTGTRTPNPLHRAADRRAVQAGLSTGIALVLGGLVSTGHQYWAAMPAFQTLAETDGQTRRKALQRIVATVLGAALAFGVAIAGAHSPFVAFPILFVSVFLMAFTRVTSSPWTAFWQTVMLATMYDVIGTLDVETTEVRVLETVIGAGVALVVSAVVLPTRTRTRVAQGMSAVVQRAAVLVQGVFARAGGASTPTGTDLTHLAQDLAVQLNGVERMSRPLRHHPGSLDRSGIEAQLTALWSMLAFAREAVRDLPGAPRAGLTADDWQRFATATADDFAAARTVLVHRVPERLHGAEALDDDIVPGQDAQARALLLALERLDQAILAFIDAVSPGTVDAVLTRPEIDAARARPHAARF